MDTAGASVLMKTPMAMNRPLSFSLILASIVIVLLTRGVGIAKDTPAATPLGKPIALQLHAQSSGEEKSAQPIRLRGADARQQLLATAKFSTGSLRDYTRQVSYQISPAHVAHINKHGYLTP